MIAKVRFPQFMLADNFDKLGGTNRFGEVDSKNGMHYGKVCHMTDDDYYRDEVDEKDGAYFKDGNKIDSYDVYDRVPEDYVYILDSDRCQFVAVLESIAKLH